MKPIHKKKKSKQIKLPAQLASLIQNHSEDVEEAMDMEAAVQEEEEEEETKNRSESKKKGSLNSVVAAARNRHVKELASYVRAVCMRLDLGKKKDAEL